MSLHADTVITFTRLELLCALRHLRIRKEHVTQDLGQLQELYSATSEATTHAAMLAMDTELATLTAIIQLMWLPIAGGIVESTREKKKDDDT